MVGDGLRMIAGGRRNDPAAPLLLGQLEQFVERAALLVGGGELEVLELEPDFRADDLRQGAADQHRRADDRALDPRRGGANIVDRRNALPSGASD